MTPPHSPLIADRGRIARAPVAATSMCTNRHFEQPRAADLDSVVTCQPVSTPALVPLRGHGDARSMSELEPAPSFEVAA